MTPSSELLAVIGPSVGTASGIPALNVSRRTQGSLAQSWGLSRAAGTDPNGAYQALWPQSLTGSLDPYSSRALLQNHSYATPANDLTPLKGCPAPPTAPVSAQILRSDRERPRLLLGWHMGRVLAPSLSPHLKLVAKQ